MDTRKRPKSFYLTDELVERLGQWRVNKDENPLLDSENYLVEVLCRDYFEMEVPIAKLRMDRRQIKNNYLDTGNIEEIKSKETQKQHYLNVFKGNAGTFNDSEALEFAKEKVNKLKEIGIEVSVEEILEVIKK